MVALARRRRLAPPPVLYYQHGITLYLICMTEENASISALPTTLVCFLRRMHCALQRAGTWQQLIELFSWHATTATANDICRLLRRCAHFRATFTMVTEEGVWTAFSLSPEHIGATRHATSRCCACVLRRAAYR